MTRFLSLLLLLGIGSMVSAQDILKLSNSTGDPIIMKYLPRNQRPNQMNKVTIEANGQLDLVLQGDDPFDVSFQIPSEDGKPNFQAKVGIADGVPLRQLARDNIRYDIALTFAAKEQRGKVLTQVMSGKFVTPNGDVTDAILSANNGSQFVETILDDPWDSTYVANNGTNVKAEIDFNNLTFRTSSFQGSFHDLMIFEDDKGCHIVARWAAGSSKGDAYFTIAKNQPRSLRGEYTFDGQPKRHDWNGKQK